MFGDEGAKALGESTSLAGLTHLYIGRNYFGPDGAQVIYESKTLTGLKTLVLKEGVEGIQDSYQFRLFLTTMSKFHDYSIGNLILIMLQKPDATRVAGFSTWKDLYRWVKKGEKGIAILSPCMPPKGAKSSTPESAEIRPQYPYALSKYLGEQIALHWAQVYDLPVISLRMFNVYGPRQNPDGPYAAVVARFTNQLLSKKPIEIFGSGLQTRDFIPVEEVVLTNLAAGRLACAQGEVFNVGSGGTYSINRLTDYLGGEKQYIPKRPGEPDVVHCDASGGRRLSSEFLC